MAIPKIDKQMTSLSEFFKDQMSIIVPAFLKFKRSKNHQSNE